MLDIDRDRQRISLGLKQTRGPLAACVENYTVGDELAGKVTKVVQFGAFVEILDGVEGLVHISELAPHHVESPREVVHPGDEIRVKILEIDTERRRLSLSAKRVEGQVLRGGANAGAEADVEDFEAPAPEAVVEEPAQPTTEGVEPAAEGVEPAAESVDPAADSAEPTESVEPTADSGRTTPPSA